MSQQSILVVEDEPIIADDIATSLEAFGYRVHDVVGNVGAALDSIAQKLPDLALVDINLDGEKSGIELGQQFHSRYKLPFMYITSYFDEETIRQVKQTQPLAYIIKPFDDRDLRVNLELAFAKQQAQPAITGKFFVKQNNQLIAIEPQKITHVEAIDNYAYVYTPDARYMVSHTLKSIEEKLAGRGFVRVHKSYLVNLDYINSISEGLILLDQAQIPIGKAYKQSLYDHIITL